MRNFIFIRPGKRQVCIGIVYYSQRERVLIRAFIYIWTSDVIVHFSIALSMIQCQFWSCVHRPILTRPCFECWNTCKKCKQAEIKNFFIHAGSSRMHADVIGSIK